MCMRSFVSGTRLIYIEGFLWCKSIMSTVSSNKALSVENLVLQEKQKTDA